MSKMSAPQMDVIRFNERDVIVASNGGRRTLTISGTGNGVDEDALFILGGKGGSWGSEQVALSNPLFLMSINSYLGTDFESSSNINAATPNNNGIFVPKDLGTLAARDYAGGSDSALDLNYNVSYTWNSSTSQFERQ